MKIFNTMSRKKEEFVPLKEGKVGIYACGPTVYNFFHVGNSRMFIVFDVLRRYLEYSGYEVTYVQNFTDIDDKVIRRANEEGVTYQDISDRYIKEYFTDADALGVKRATVHPKATDHMDQIIGIVKALVEKGLAYVMDGDVYYDTSAFSGYGKLSGQNLEDLNAGARVDVDEKKKNPADFALWKAQKPGEPAWESPWGLGRPGWHIECSAMSMTYLGDTFDIHCGGQDLIFPHHENEIAQSEGASGKPFVRYWMHNGFLNIDNQKMSKSLNNFFTVRDITKEFEAEDIRMFMLSAHYRSPLNFSREMMMQAHASLQRLYSGRDRAIFLLDHAKDAPLSAKDEETLQKGQECVARFKEAMDDDLNTAEATGALFDLVYEINTSLNETSPKELVARLLDLLKGMAGTLGLLMKTSDELPLDVKNLADERAQARKNKDWKRSDELRDAIKLLGYSIEDTPQGQKIGKLS